MAANILGERILLLLKQQNLTQRELADRVGVTEVSMSRYINGERTPRSPVIAAIATALHTTSDYLLGQEAVKDSELEYYRVQRIVAQNTKYWSKKQKADLICALLELDE